MPRGSALAVLSVLLLWTACVPPEREIDLARDYEIDTVMGEIQERGHIIIGIAQDAYPLGYVDFNNEARGFTVALGQKIAETLGVEARFISGPSEELLELPKEDLADVTFPAITIREPLVRQYAFSDPYFISHQRLLVRVDGGGEDAPAVASVDDLAGGTVCSVAGEESGVALDEIHEGIEVLSSDPQDCLRLLQRDRVQAITGPDYLLAGLRDVDRNKLLVTGGQLTTEAIGAVVERGASAWVDFVNGCLYLAEQEGIWERSYGEHLEDALGPRDLPTMTLEEAAALYPRGV